MNIRKYNINGKFYDLENVAETIKQGRWNEAVDMLAGGAGISNEQASAIAQELAAAIGIGQNDQQQADNEIPAKQPQPQTVPQQQPAPQSAPQQQASQPVPQHMPVTQTHSTNMGASISSVADKLSGKKIANVIKILAAVSAALGIIVSLVTGVTIGRASSYLMMSESNFSFTAFLISIFSTLVVSSMMYGFGEVISLLVDIKNKEK